MKRFIIVVFSFLALNVYAQGNQEKNLDKLVSEAIKRGPVSKDVYQIDNKKNLYVEEKEALKYFERNNYIVFEKSSKSATRFGESMVTIDKISFAPYDSYVAKKYMFDQLKGDNPTSYDQVKNSGYYFYPKYEEKTIWGYYTKTVYQKSDVDMWSGTTVDGFLNGKGIGYYFIDNRMYVFEGEFVAGFPSEKITYKKYKRPSESETFQSNSIDFNDVLWMKDTAKGDLRKAVVNYAHIYNNENASIVNGEFEKALSLNNSNGDFGFFYSSTERKAEIEKNIRVFNQLVKINSGLNLSEFNNLDKKIKELMKLYDVLSVLDNSFYQHNYITESILWGTTYEMTRATSDTSIFFKTDRYISENAKATSKSSFKKFFAAIEPTMYDRSKRLYSNINKQIQQYNGMDKTPDIFHQPSTSYASSSSSSSNSKSDRNDYNEKSESKSNGTDSKKMLSCKVKIKLPDGTYYKGGNVECWIHEGRWSDEGGYVKCWVDGDGNCTISWEEKRGDYIYEILNICQFGKCYNVKGVELKNGGNYTLSAKAN